MKRKDSSISLIGLVPEMRQVLTIVDKVWKQNGKEAVITAGTEAFKGNKFIHSVGSLHPFGKALDFRTNHFTIPRTIYDINVPYTAKINREKIRIIVARVKAALGKDYDVVVHLSHLHIEYDPKPEV